MIFNKDSKIKCEICGEEFKKYYTLTKHLKRYHNMNYKEYYDKFYKKENEEKCKICEKTCNFEYRSGGYYRTYCCYKCSNFDEDLNNIKKINRDFNNNVKYGVKNVMLVKSIKDKHDNTCQQLYGGNSALANKSIRAKGRSTMKKLYGVEYAAQTDIFLNKMTSTMKKLYGVEYALQNNIIFKEMIKNSRKRKEYQLKSGKKIYLQGYEPQFLDFIFNNNLLREDEISYTPFSIEYMLNNKIHRYLPDFYISKHNLIVEIKGSYIYTLKKQEILLKEEYTRKSGYNYIIVIDNDFSELHRLLLNFKLLDILKFNI